MAGIQIDLTALRESFLEEARDHIAELERGLLELEAVPGDTELLNRIFRAAHSLKGGSGSFGFQSITRFTHVLENLLDPMREGKIPLSEAVADLLLRSVDVLSGLLNSAKTGEPEPVSFEPVLGELSACLGRLGLTGVSATQRLEDKTGVGTFEVKFVPGPELFLQGMSPVLLLRNLGELGTVSATELHLDAVPRLEELDPERCYLSWSVCLSTERTQAEIRDIFAFVEDTSQIEIVELGREWHEPPASVSTPESGPAVAAAAPARAASANPGPARAKVGSKASTLRVATEKVDKLVDLVGELVIAQSMVAQALNEPSKDALARAMEALADMERNTRELQERVMAVRMVPVGTVFNRFPRLVRDLSARCGKDVQLEMTGQDIEIDKGIVEEIADPLTHLLRNALDHGIEASEERLRAGKSRAGTIRLAAYHQGGSVIVEVSDDGRGLNTARIREKGLALGLMREGEELSEEQIHALIFAPGFSTASAVTDVSGRGVGMDVVKRNVDALNGSLTVTSRAGAGTCVRIKLPLTLAIMDGLSLRIGQQIFVLPLLPIVESIRPSSQQLKSLLGRGEVVYVRDEAIPLVRLYQLLGVEPEETDPRRALVVIVETGTTKLGLLVDELLGQAQVVVKSLELNYRKVDAVMGATILGTGRIALILDVEGLARRTLTNPQLHPSKSSAERGAESLASTTQHKETAHVTAGYAH